MSQARMNQMKELLTAALSPTSLELIDDSQQHVGHAGALAGGGHFTVRIASAAFDGESLVSCHRKVYQALGDMMESDIHALSIDIIR